MSMESKILVVQDDITQLNVDAIVNAANRSLCGGGGVDGAIHRAAGNELLTHCRTLQGCETGQSVITPGFKLVAKYIIHTVGPVWYGGHRDEKELLASCYDESLALAVRYQLNSIAFPAISCGAYRFPLKDASRIAVDTITDFLKDDRTINEVVLCCYDAKIFRALQKTIED